MPASRNHYRGRFAPSPTGPLHFGSLVAAVASYLQALAHNGEWLVRIEDLDPPRESPAAAEDILRALDAHGFNYDPPLYQSSRLEVYDEIIAGLLRDGAAYHCACTRRMLRQTCPRGRAGLIYPGTCRAGLADNGRPATAVRAITTDEPIEFNDLLQGHQSCALESEIGDFLIRRGDGLVAYQLAVVADDQHQGITEVVRGIDLLDSTFMQLRLQELLHYDQLVYAHIPVATDRAGQKLSKQTGALPINIGSPVKNLFQAFVFLNMIPPAMLAGSTLAELWAWGQEHWHLNSLTGKQKPVNESIILQ